MSSRSGSPSPYSLPSNSTVSTEGKLINYESRGEASALPDSLAPLNPNKRNGSIDGTPISRPGSAASMRVRVDKPSLEAISGSSLYSKVGTGFERELSL